MNAATHGVQMFPGAGRGGFGPGMMGHHGHNPMMGGPAAMMGGRGMPGVGQMGGRGPMNGMGMHMGGHMMGGRGMGMGGMAGMPTPFTMPGAEEEYLPCLM